MLRRALSIAWLALCFSLPASAQVAFETLNADTSNSTFNEITGGNDAKSSWVELTSSSGIAAKLVYVGVRHDSNANGPEYLIDIGTGAASSEVVLIPDIPHMPGNASNDSMMTYYGPFQVDVASSTRWAARVEAQATFQDLDIGVILASELLPELSSISYNAYGITSGSSPKMVVIDPGETANTKGSYSQITASVSSTAEWVTFSIGQNTNNALEDYLCLVDVATGSAASETVKIANIMIASDSVSDQYQPYSIGPFPADVFQSQRVAVRAQCDGTDATDRLFNFAMVVASGTPASGGGSGGVMPMGGLIKR